MVDVVGGEYLEKQILTKISEQLKTRLANAHSTIVERVERLKKSELEHKTGKVICESNIQ